jgi:CHAT domain-containing protein
VSRFRAALRDPDRQDARRLGRTLDALLVEPLRAQLGGVTRLLISPDGALNLIPFEALVDRRGQYAIQSYAISYLTSGRDLLRLQVPRERHSVPLVLADPEFGEPKEGPASGSRSARPRSVTTTRDLASTYFAPLAGTAAEARSIRTLFPNATVLTRERATKAAVRTAQAPGILHIASHGFFLEDIAPPAGAPGTRTAAAAAQSLDNPLVRSGMALAQANARRQGADSGILTALEAANLNLWGTQLVTLSACDTGLGEVKQGEGVYGLRRAFLLAGSESLVMSLWPVSDHVTRRMMTTYYTGLKQGRGRGDALRDAQLSMLKAAKEQHPYYWAGFIQAGAWTPLQMDGGRGDEMENGRW